MDYNAVVVGAGHAGIEAGLALARLGFSTILITQNLDTIGNLSCNPAIGGLAKGNMVREIDALGGEMGRIIDDTMIQFRILNRSRGPAVQAPRAQADKPAYRQRAKHVLELTPNLHLFQDTVVDLLTGRVSDNPVKGGADPALWCDKQITGVVTQRGSRITADVVVLTTGTFMNGVIHIGLEHKPGGRIGEIASVGLSDNLRELGMEVGSLKTGTPARLDGKTIDFSRLEEQGTDSPVIPFSFSTKYESGMLSSLWKTDETGIR